MKHFLFYAEALLYIIYLLILIFVLIPYAKSSINLSGGKSYKYVAYGLTIVPFLMGSFFLYKGYQNINAGIFYLYFLLALLIPLIIVPFLMFLMG